eukprot:TRINITY_DN6065_c0_g1_i1.p1 TRINITY_DN6065_c0_g1~~TRINITY_DN6065_c0_g1_i1.p1  ORF type:complete len:925 (+),score=312.52 TRINITY_DN6065_c0_g1_i1:76-2775(+)
MALSSSQYYNQLCAAAAVLQEHIGTAQIAIVLGSGLNSFTDHLQNPKTVEYNKVPFFPLTSVKGHNGRAVTGDIALNNGSSVRVLCFAGRVHAYEGYFPYQFNFFVRVASLLGCGRVILTNAAGGGLQGMQCGAVLIIRDHLRWNYVNALSDIAEDSRFHVGLEHTHYYSQEMGQVALAVGKRLGVNVMEGVYGWTSGPTYETPAEVKAGLAIGLGAFGMSTVPEVIAANAINMEVFAMSLITNMGAGLAEEILTHAAVTQQAALASVSFQQLLLNMLRELNYESKPAHLAVPRLPTSKPNLAATLSHLPHPAHIRQAAQAVRQANLGEASPELVLWPNTTLPREQEFFMNNLLHTRYIPFTDLPHFDQYFRSCCGRQGGLLLGTLKNTNQRVCCVTGQTLEGLESVEAWYIVQTLNLVGVRKMAFSFMALFPADSPYVSLEAAADSAACSDVRLLVLDDLVNFTMSKHLPVSVPSSATQRPAHHQFFSSSLLSRCLALCEEQKVESGVWSLGSVMALGGPALPSQAELYVAKLAGCQAVMATNPAPLLAARDLAWTVCGLGCVHSKWGSASDFASVPDFSAAVQACALEMLATASETQEAKQELLEADAADSFDTCLGNDSVQEVFEDVQQAADACRVTLCLNNDITNRTAFFVHPLFNQSVLPQFDLTHRVQGSELPFWKEHHVGGWGYLSKHWEISVTADQKSLVIAAPTAGSLFTQLNTPAFDRLNFVTRMLKFLGVAKIAFVAPLTSLTSELQYGDVILPNDHINLTGRNPLFGINEDRWGTRFPDAQGCYHPALRASVQQTAQDLNIPLKSSIMVHIEDQAAGESPALRTWANTLHATTMCSGVIPHVILARQMELPCVMLGSITNHPDQHGYQPASLSASAQANIAQLLKSL